MGELIDTRGDRPIRYVPAAFVLAELAGRSDEASAALRKPYVAIDEYGRILGISEDVARRLGVGVRSLVGRRLSYRIVGPERPRFSRSLLALRDSRVASPMAFRLHACGQRHELAQFTPLLAAETHSNVLVAIFSVVFGAE